ncbi:MAG: hypothetical protein COW01_13430 [Bdellovibrionales bacterium CG12_big_fil_rev_8_21_14_0_65_38_15]|nr:MAG: hypothetical protein COW79_16245 [Bdellovibrionales bacterium CG22_combo_CG10-13_8_21_14_all_38_13]PIQ53276.1 MAG: hypothetical protein COW01_13430 [Bdellovibrionales bacterium CG12_big_fil_rev_8_21_14_0_65_38_15]
MNRKLFLNIHLYLAAFFLPFLLLMPITGVSYLLGEKGAKISRVEFSTNEVPPQDKTQQKEWIKNQFENNNIDFDWEYIKPNGNDLILRPSSKDHYIVSVQADKTDFIKIEPNLLLKLIELHKGHGPALFKSLEISAGIGLILLTISGIFLSFYSRSLRKKFLLPLIIGSIVTVLAILI